MNLTDGWMMRDREYPEAQTLSGTVAEWAGSHGIVTLLADGTVKVDGEVPVDVLVHVVGEWFAEQRRRKVY